MNGFVRKKYPRRDIGKGWFVEYDRACSMSSQHLVFDVPGEKAMHHTGQMSIWLINGDNGRVLYCSGDSFRKPDKNTVGRACEALKQLDEEGLLFSR